MNLKLSKDKTILLNNEPIAQVIFNLNERDKKGTNSAVIYILTHLKTGEEILKIDNYKYFMTNYKNLVNWEEVMDRAKQIKALPRKKRSFVKS